ncbi:hypothetical protein IV203_029455 [Nitzschia inconspicua]|uniref:Uncharacterized protein n=1 Tax=Nitzschia inconspicua TaxID=303405 RepID=A0A9K3LQM8_9STRA|nr:hypothetical protein IV203_029455 [Nitzschia inconspicua]
MSIPSKASAMSQSPTTAGKRRLYYGIKRRRDHRNKNHTFRDAKNAIIKATAKLYAFPEIAWIDDEREESASFDDYGSSSSSSLDDDPMIKCCSSRTAEYWINEASNKLHKISLDQNHHMHRSMAFFDLDSLVVNSLQLPPSPNHAK